MSNIVMRAARRRSIEANLFPFAQAAVEPWDDFRWHGAAGESCDAYKEHSSQALAIDLFGTLKVHPGREAVLDSLAERLGLPAGGPWDVALEWHDPENRLREKQPTWVDAVARSPRSLLFFECKFRESDGGTCSQTRPISTGRRKGQVQCNGHYLRQVNPANGREARCALAAKGIRYWEVIPQVFDFDADRSYVPCPFAGPWFQWMRNLTNGVAVARDEGLRPGFVVVFADGPGLAMAQRVRLPEWQRFAAHVDAGAVTLAAVSFQEMVALARAAQPNEAVWRELAVWIERKISSVCGIQDAPL